MSLSEAIQKVFDFLSEYDSLYHQEGATLAVSEQLMVDAEEFLDQTCSWTEMLHRAEISRGAFWTHPDL